MSNSKLVNYTKPRNAAQRAAEDVVMTPNWTTDRPTEPGEYWVSKPPKLRAVPRDKMRGVTVRCKKVADHTNGTTDHSELCDACWSAEFSEPQEAMAS